MYNHVLSYQPPALLADEKIEADRCDMFQSFSFEELDEIASAGSIGTLLKSRYGECRGLKVLELGPAATIFVASSLSSNLDQYIGLDYSLVSIEKQAQRLRSAGMTNATGLHGSTYRIPLPDCSQDVIYAGGHDPLVRGTEAMFRQSFGEVSRVLKPDGELILDPCTATGFKGLKVAENPALLELFCMVEAVFLPAPSWVSAWAARRSPECVGIFRKNGANPDLEMNRAEALRLMSAAT